MDGNVTLSTELDTRPITQSLSNLKKKIVDVFKGADVKTLSAGLKAVNAEIKATEAQARKAQSALDALMRGEKEPQVIKVINSELKSAQSELTKTQTKLDALLSGRTEPKATKAWLAELKTVEKEYAELEKKANAAGAVLAKDLQPKHPRGYTELTDKQRDDLRAEIADYDTRMSALQNRATELKTAIGAVRMHPELTNEAKRYQAQIDELQKRIEALQLAEQDVRQNPALTVEAQEYQQQINDAKVRLDELRAKQEELGQSAQKVGLAVRLQQNSVVGGFQHIERRIMGLIKRVFFFSLITKALRAVRSQVSAIIASDSALSTSLAQVKANLATSFGMIFQAVVPALRTMVNWLAKATAYIAAFISWLTGKSFKQGQEVFQAANDASAGVASNTGKIGKAAKKAAKEAQRMLLPFDQMNVLSKDNANGGSGGGGGGAGGAGGLGNTTWPKEIDSVMAKFEKFKDLILLIGAAFAAWKLSKLFSTLLGISRIKAFVGLTALIAGIVLLVRGIRDLKKNGPTVENICDIIAGALLAVGGAFVLFTGATGLGLIIIAIGLVVLAFKNLYKNFKPFKKFVDTLIKKVKEFSKKFVEGFVKGFKTVISKIKNFAKDLKKAYQKGGIVEVGKFIILGIIKGIAKAVKKLGSLIKKHIVDPFIKWIKKKFGIASPAKTMLDIGKNIMLGVLEGIIQQMKNIGNWVKEHVLEPIKEALLGDDGLFVKISAFFTDTKEALQEKWNNLTSAVSDKTAEMKATIKQKWEDIKTSWTNLTSNISEKTAEMKATVKQKWDNIKTSWTDITKNIADKTAEMKAKIGTAWNDIKSKWTNITSNISGKTAEMKAKVGTKWSSLKNTWNSLLSHFGDKTFQMKVKLPKISWSTKTFKKGPISIDYPWPSVSWLAQGGVIPANKEFLAVLGDQKRGVNIETPLQTMIDAFNTALKQNGYNGNQNVNVYLQGDAKQLFRVVRVEANNYTQATGKAAFNI